MDIICDACNKVCNTNEHSLQCAICKKFIHKAKECSGISNSSISKSTSEQVRYFCMKCKDINLQQLVSTGSKKAIDSVETRIGDLDKLIKTLQEVKADLTKCLDEINDLKQTISSLADRVTKLETSHVNSDKTSGILGRTDIERTEFHNNDYNYQIIISGLPETTNSAKNGSSKMDSELHDIKQIFNFMKISEVNVINLYRLGKIQENRKRKLLVKFQSIWDVRKVISNCKRLKEYNIPGLFISRDLSQADRVKEQRALKARYNLIQNGTSKDRLKIKGLKLFKDGVEIPESEL